MEKVMDDLKLAEAKQKSFFNLMNEFESKSSLILSLPLHWKDLDLQYESIREALRKHVEELALKRTEIEEAGKKVELQEMEVQKLETAHGVLDAAKHKEREMGLLDSQLQMKERDLRFVRERVEECEAELERKEMEMRVLERTLTKTRKQICEKEGERDCVEKSIELNAREMRAKDDCLGQIRNLISKCNEELELKEKELCELEMKVSRKREELCSLQNSLALRHDDMEKSGNLVSNRTSELESKKKELGEVSAIITKLKSECELNERHLITVEKERNLAEVCELKDREFAALKNLMTECKAQLESKEEQLSSVVEELEEKQQQLEFVKNAFEVNIGDPSDKEQELCLLEEKVQNAVNAVSVLNSEHKLKEEELDEVKKLIIMSNAEHKLKEEKIQLLCKEIDLKETELCGIKASIEECLKDLDMKKEEVHATRNLCEKQHEDIYLNQVRLDSVCEMVKEYDEELESKKELYFLKENLQASVENLELKETVLSSIETSIKAREKVLESMKEQTISIKTLIEEFALALESSVEKTFDVAGEQMKQCCGRLESRKTELIELRKKLTEERKDVEEHAVAVETERLELQKEVEQFKLKEKQLVSKEKLMEERVAEIEAKEKQPSNLLDEQRNKQQPEFAKELVGAIGCDSSTSPDSLISKPSQPCLTDIAVSAVSSSSDPALVLFHLLEQSFSRPAADDITAGRSRILFLEQFMSVSQTVQPELKEEAKNLADTWRGSLSHCSSTDDVLAYLLFLAAFGISSHFKAEDTLELVSMIAHSDRGPELCRSLGLAKCIPGLIVNLCKNNKHMDAIRFSLAFNIVAKFPPDVILRDYLKKTRIFEDGMDLLESQHQALNIHLDSLKALSQGVARLGHDPGFVIRMISHHLEVLETHLVKKRSCLLAAGLVIKRPNLNVGGTTVSGHKWPQQATNLTREELSNKRQKR